ncbi:MAG: hypothetical protein ACI9F9_003022 [Candidatus Paceibacteria bacterium]|jgi:hypothetical protein
MIRTTLATIAALCIAGILAANYGGLVQAGIIAGGLLGTSIAGLGACWQRHNFLYRQKRAFSSVIETFLVKLGLVAIAVLVIRFVPAVGSQLDIGPFLLTFVGTAYLVQTVAVFENVRLLKKSPKNLGASSPSPGEPALAPTQAE